MPDPRPPFRACSNLPTSTRSLVLSALSLPVHAPPHCFPPNLISKLSSPWKASSKVLFWLRPSPFSPDLCAKYEHRTVSCALSNSCTNPFRIVFDDDDPFIVHTETKFILFADDSTAPSSLRLLLNVCACTDPHVPPTKIISLTFHPSFSPSAYPATFSRLLTRTSC